MSRMNPKCLKYHLYLKGQMNRMFLMNLNFLKNLMNH
jgi:hypothetical protein